jgi:hypothetical protein
MKLGKDTASVSNWILSSASKLPVVGEGATELQWTDRRAYEVLSVSNNGRECVIEQLECRFGSDGYPVEYTPTGSELKLKFRYGSWWVIGNNFPNANDELFNGDWKVQPYKINIIFGRRDAYYDHSF